jgi:hypothetical protein
MKQAKHFPTLTYALKYAKNGFAVVPMHTVKNGVCSCSKGTKCPNPGKHPSNVNGVKGASTNPEQIREWWTAHPEANIGIACGTISNIFALDIDPRNGGQKTLLRMTKKLGNLNSTVVSNTGGGGTHHVFKLPKFRIQKDSGGKIFGAGLDVISDGAIIIVPPSVHASGEPYRWRMGASFKNSPSSLPKRWRNHIETQQDVDRSKSAGSKSIVVGMRNETLTSIAGKLRIRVSGRTHFLRRCWLKTKNAIHLSMTTR